MSEEEEESSEHGFRVTDKRKIRRDEAQASEPAAQTGEGDPKDNAGVNLGSAPEGSTPIDFGNFIMSLAHSALVSLGMVEHPEGGGMVIDLDTARQTIQILEMLQGKTRNNLEEEEDQLITSLLYELRMAFVDVAAKNNGK